MSIKWKPEAAEIENGRLFLAGCAVSDSGEKITASVLKKSGEAPSDLHIYELPASERTAQNRGGAEDSGCGFEIECNTDGEKKFILILSDGKTQTKVNIAPEGLIGRFRTKKRADALKEAGKEYLDWLDRQRPGREELERQRSEVFEKKTRISVIVPMFRADPGQFSDMAESLLAQTYSNWELCICDGGALEGPLEKELRRFEQKDPRIHAVVTSEELGTGEMMNRAMAIATGEFYTFSGADDLYEPDAMYRIASKIAEVPDTDLVYADEDSVSADGEYFSDPVFKACFDRQLFFAKDTIGRPAVFRAELTEDVGEARDNCDGAQEYDFLLRYISLTERVEHIDRVCYHRRRHAGTAASAREEEQNRRAARVIAVRNLFEEQGVSAEVSRSERTGFSEIHYNRQERRPSMSVIFSGVSDFGRMSELQELLRSWGIERGEVLLSTAAGILQRPKGAVVLFLNSEELPEGSEWLDELLGVLADESVGAAYGRILDPDGRVVQAGLSLEKGGEIVRMFADYPDLKASYGALADLRRETLGAVPEFFLTKGDLYRKTGGIRFGRTVLNQGMDYCLKLREEGYKTVYVPQALLRMKKNPGWPASEPLKDRESEFRQKLCETGDPYLAGNLHRKSDGDYEVRLG